MHIYRVGSPVPLGATVDANGVNFSLFAQHATAVELLLFDSPAATQPSEVCSAFSRTLYYWHVYVQGLRPGAIYAYRVSGPNSTQDLSRYGHRYNRNKVLLDPYARGNLDDLWVEARALDRSDNADASMRSVVIETAGYDWEGDRPPNTPRRNTIIYELHVRGFTRSASSGVAHPGSFRGLIDKIAFIKGLGVTAVELMPIFDFDQKTTKRVNPGTEESLHNYWGYDPFSFFAPQSAYCISPDRSTHVTEFRDMVKAFHHEGIEVILDVVFNHTSEGNQDGPVISLKGIDNSVYYYLEDNAIFYKNYTNCGNTLACNHPAVAKLIEECVSFWANEMHIDGFRFDLGSILAVDEGRRVLKYPPVVWAIDLDPTLADVKVIAEPFGATQALVGSFPDIRWATWNYLYRDAVRRFVRGDPGIVGEVATRIAGSADIYGEVGQKPVNGISYVCCHDGFTLNDLVSYNYKHNRANAGDSGDDDNHSWNCGAEGDTNDPYILRLRDKQVRNFLTILFVSQGVPMLLAGDEFRRTQAGNNDPWCQDNATSWVDWQLGAGNRDLTRFVSGLIDFRKRHEGLRRETFFAGAPSSRGLLDIQWHGCRLNQPGWQDSNCRVLSFTIADPADGEDVHTMLNMSEDVLGFELPLVPGRQWFRVVDTSLLPPDDFAIRGQEVLVTGSAYLVNPRSSVVLVSK